MDTSGYIIQSGSPAELYKNPKNSYVTEFFGETNRFCTNEYGFKSNCNVKKRNFMRR